MRSDEFKLVYYIGQQEGELYDLRNDRDELWNRWSDLSYSDTKQGLMLDLLDWLASSNYWNAGYRRARTRQYRMRWPTEQDVNLHGRPDILNQFTNKW